MFQQTDNENKEKTLTKTDLGRVWIGWVVTLGRQFITISSLRHLIASFLVQHIFQLGSNFQIATFWGHAPLILQPRHCKVISC